LIADFLDVCLGIIFLNAFFKVRSVHTVFQNSRFPRPTPANVSCKDVIETIAGHPSYFLYQWGKAFSNLITIEENF